MATQNNNIDNLSDVRPDSALSANVSPAQLPIRGEKRIINAPVSPDDANSQFEQAWTKTGRKSPEQKGYKNTGRKNLVEYSDYYVSAAMSPYIDYVLIRLYNRGLGLNGMPDNSPAVYRFLINPSQVVVNRTTLDAQSMTRAGWQIGVWGEDSLMINLVGRTAGQYFAFGTTDRYQPYTESYRNLEQLQVVFENNGYWFEGEQLGEGPLAANGPGFGGGADFTRRVIKMHADVELIVGNFIWYGMFDSLTISQSADEPFLMDFNLSFVAWKERYRQNSPYKDLLHNNVLRGHDYGVWQSAALTTSQAQGGSGTSTTVALSPNTGTITGTPAPVPAAAGTGAAAQPSAFVPPAQPAPVAPAVAVAQAANAYPQVSPDSNDTCYNDPTLGASAPQYFGGWNNVTAPLTFGNGGKTT